MAEHYMRDVPMGEMVPPPVVPAEPPHPLDALLPEFASFMDMVKVDFTARGLWTEYDQGLRDRITAYNLAKLRGAAGVVAVGHQVNPPADADGGAKGR